MAMHIKLIQSGVSQDFTMMVPSYLEMTDKTTRLIGRAKMVGNATVEQTLPLGKLGATAKRVVVNYNYDLLSDSRGNDFGAW